MSTEQWDSAFQTLCQNFDHTVPFSFQDTEKRLAIAQKYSAIYQFEQAIEEQIQLIQHYQSSYPFGKKKLLAIFEWYTHLAEHRKTLLNKLNQLIKRSLWLNLVRQGLQLNGKITGAGDLELVELATKEVELKNLEKALEAQLVRISEKKKRLRIHYEHHEAMRSNHEAAASLQTEIFDINGKKSVPYMALKDFIHNLSTISRPPHSEAAKLERDLVTETNSLIKECRKILTKDIGPEHMTLEGRRLRILEQRLTALNGLQKQVQELHQKDQNSPLKELHPIMVKKNPTRGTRKPQKPETA